MFNCLNMRIVLIFIKNFNKWLCRWVLRAKIFIYSLSGFIKSLNKHCYRNLYNSLIKVNKPIFLELTLQRLKHVGFLYTFTSKYTLKHIRLMKFYKTFTTKDTSVSINDSIRLVSKPFIYSLFKLLYYLNFSYLLIYLLPNYEVDRNFQIVHYTYQYQNSLNHHLYSLLRKQNKYLFVF